MRDEVEFFASGRSQILLVHVYRVYRVNALVVLINLRVSADLCIRAGTINSYGCRTECVHVYKYTVFSHYRLQRSVNLLLEH